MNTPVTILLIEDDVMIAEPLLFGFKAEGYQVQHADNGPEGLNLARTTSPDLILLDVMLPGMDGFQVLRHLRRELATPVIMLTARGQEMDRVMGLESGADDYVVKPFSFRELLARVRATLRRIHLEREHDRKQASTIITVGPISLDVTAHLARKNGKLLELTEKEFALLQALLERAGQVVPRQRLLDLVWGENWIGSPRTLDVHIRWLRAKIEDAPSQPRFIQTSRGYGYRFVAEDELAA